MNNHLLKTISSFLLLWLTITTSCAEEAKPTEETAKEAPQKRITLEYELDAYYSNIGLYIGLTDKPIPDAGEKEEIDIYKELLFSSYIPRFFIVEAAVFPMPILGVYLKDNARDLYENAQISGDLNIIKAATAGFEEPYALSVFMGKVVRFTTPNDEWRRGNFGYMGYLVSTGNYHIKDNELIDDEWWEIEWKVKGDRKFTTHDLHWSFRVGGKLHGNEDIADVVYLALRRSRLDFEESTSFFKNSGFEYVFSVDSQTFTPVKQYLTVEKKWPFKERKIAFSLAVGFLWQSDNLYSGALGGEEDFQVIIRPNIQF